MTYDLGEFGPETNIVLAGQVCIDRNDIEGREYTTWGSAVLHMADYYQQQHGVSPTVLSARGADFSDYAPSFSLYPIWPGKGQTLVYENVVRDAVRSQRCRNNDGESLPPVDESMERILGSADMFALAPLTDVYEPGYVKEMLGHVPEDCLKVLLPQGYLRAFGEDGSVGPRDFEEEADLISDFDLLIISEEDIADASVVAQEWKKKHPNTKVVVTRGPGGASIIEQDREISVPTEAIGNGQAVDTIGCGDTFSAAAAWHLFEDPSDLLGAVQKANAAARQKMLAAAA